MRNLAVIQGQFYNLNTRQCLVNNSYKYLILIKENSIFLVYVFNN